MKYCSEFDLLSGAPIRVEGVGDIRPITLEELRYEYGVGMQTYNLYTSLIAQGIDELIRLLQIEELYRSMSTEEKALLSTYDIYTTVPSFRELLLQALDFFIVQKVVWDKKQQCFHVLNASDAVCGKVDHDTFPTVRSVIIDTNFLQHDDIAESQKFANDKAKAIFEKMMIGRSRKKKTVKSDGPSLTEIISAVCSKSNGYTLLNIWGLTVYQLFDQFMRLNAYHQIDIHALRWAAWGSEPFDFTQWYQNNS